ncbi:transcobalamin beta a [Scomber scombrus]|uniref:Transcobalamin beta a n=1 Tax=Scomber scombrus TaxID=13677 RepID=A0AAV1N2S5_SCOSC
MVLNTAALLSVGLLLLLIQGTLAGRGPVNLPIRLSVVNDLSNMTPESYSSSVVEGGVLLGALRRLQETQQDFKFTVKVDSDFGLLLESVNGVSGSEGEQTYWEILSESSGEYSRLDVGIGCYIPKENEHIILKFSNWSRQ